MLAESLVWIALTQRMFYWPRGTPWLQTALFWESLCHNFDIDEQASTFTLVLAHQTDGSGSRQGLIK